MGSHIDVNPKVEPVTAGSRKSTPVFRAEHLEGLRARLIEQQSVKIPSDIFLFSAFGSMGISLGLQVMGKRQLSLFVGQWAPTLLILGLYNKLVKVSESH